METIKKVSALRRMMEEHGVHAYYIPSADPHQNEYVPEFWQRRKFISGFTGSAGDAVITRNMAGLWTDSRYFLQAEQQLDGEVFTLFKIGLPGVPSVQDWLRQELKGGEAVGIDPQVIPHKTFLEFRDRLQDRNIQIKCLPENLIDKIWEDRPSAPTDKIHIHELIYAGEKPEEKLARLRKKMADADAGLHILSKLDTIAWLYNIRGKDVEYNPVTISYAVVTKKDAFLYIDPSKLSEEVKTVLKSFLVIRSYDTFQQDLENLGKENGRILLDDTSISQWVVDNLNKQSQLVFKPNPTDLFKAIKNKVEISGVEEAHILDGSAMVRFLSWLENAVQNQTVTEISAAEKLLEFRSKNDLFVGPSFETISSYGEHGAVVHYAPTEESDIPLKPEGTYLIDSGGQYVNGTTDITRTVALGQPTDEQKDRFTRVLKGVIALTTTSFPQGTVGKQLDTIARLALWEDGLNYGHGTGHGIGHYLNVHEGPQAISPTRCTGVALEPGMITSIEPGFYKEGEYGMRTENVVLVVKNNILSRKNDEFYTFKTLTLCPIDRRMITKEMLTEKEAAWIDQYHKQVHDVLTPYLDENEKNWLKKAAQPL